MAKKIEDTLDLLKKCIVEDGGIFDLGWCEAFLYPFYKHFHDINKEIKAGALIGFWGLLCEWEDGSGFPFYTGVEDYECHHFDLYLKEFIKYSSIIKKEFPNIYFVIFESLKLMDTRDRFENEFPNLSPEFFNNVREELFYEYLEKPEDVYECALNEAGIFLNKLEQ